MSDEKQADAQDEQSTQLAQIVSRPDKPDMIAKGDYNTILDYARTLVAADPSYRPKGVNTEQEAMVIMLTGWEIGLPPMASLQEVYVVNGKPALQGRAMLALLDANPHLGYYQWGECTRESATIILHKKNPDGTWQKKPWTFTKKDAEAAGLWKKSGPWSNHPDLMLMWRATTKGMRAMFAGLLRGAAHSPEELGAPVVVHGEVVEVDREALAAGMTESPEVREPKDVEFTDDEAEVDFEAGGSAQKLEEPEPDPQAQSVEAVREVVGPLVADLSPPEEMPSWAVFGECDTAKEIGALITQITPRFAEDDAALGRTLYSFAKAQCDGSGPETWALISAWWQTGTLAAHLFDALCAREGVEVGENPFRAEDPEEAPDADAPSEES